MSEGRHADVLSRLEQIEGVVKVGQKRHDYDDAPYFARFRREALVDVAEAFSGSRAVIRRFEPSNNQDRSDAYIAWGYESEEGDGR